MVIAVQCNCFGPITVKHKLSNHFSRFLCPCFSCCLLYAQTQDSQSQSCISCLHLSVDTRQNSRRACLAVSSEVCAFLSSSLFYILPVTSCLAPCSCFSRNAFCFRDRKCAPGPWQLSQLGFSFSLCNVCNLISCSSLLRNCASLPATVDVSQNKNHVCGAAGWVVYLSCPLYPVSQHSHE